jgi:hypothetical protein
VAAASKAAGANPDTYRGYLRDDSTAYAVRPAATIEQISAVLAHQSDTNGYVLKPDDSPVEILGLKLTLEKRKIPGSPQRMMVLVIENPGDRYLAYRIDTAPSRGTKICHSKPDLRYNAMALPPGGREERSECMYRSGWYVKVTRVETLELSELGYYYISQVPPESVGIENRVASGHRPPKGSPCAVLLPQTVVRDRETGALSWRDLIDFFARHRCQTYRFPESYRAYTGGDLALPVVAGAK